MPLLPKQNFEHWIVIKLEDNPGGLLIAGTQRLPYTGDTVTVYIPFIDGFTTIRDADIVFSIRSIIPKL